ncbi:MAG: hypothetical protein K8R90_00690 [Candidatus Cloacimonetes bacterium]|nr:hypothetical protein [Candidatus Cloacimonadota bacterium]
MRKFMAMLKKDWVLSRKILLLQVWIVMGIWALTLVGGFAMYTIIKHQIADDETVTVTIAEGEVFNSEFQEIWTTLGDLIVYGANLYQVILPGMLALVFAVAILIGALNTDMRKNCEIFYRAQPVSLWWRALSKFIIGLFVTLGIMLGLTLAQFVLSNLIMTFYVDGVSWGLAFTGTMQYYFCMFFGIVLSGSLAWFFSAVFRDFAFFKAAGIVLGIGLLLIMINIALVAAPFIFNGWDTDFRVPTLDKLIFGFPIANTTLTDGFAGNIQMECPTDFEPEMLDVAISHVWKLIWGWDTLVKVVVSIGLFFAGTWIYIRKEVL